MGDSKTVMRTISFGAISSSGAGAAPSYNPMALRRHSSAGMRRALLWAATGANKSSGGSFGSELRTSRDTIFPNILTPDSIPPFTIPSLSVQANGARAPADSAGDLPGEEERGPDAGECLGAELASSLSISIPTSSAKRRPSPSKSWSSSHPGAPQADHRAQRTYSDPLAKMSLKRERCHPGPHAAEVHQHCLDPASRAAFSLPHLAKVTTPYGFVTLSQSPQMASEETLLCQAGLHRPSAKRDEGAPSGRGDRAETPGRRGATGTKDGDGSGRRAASKDSADAQTAASSCKQPSGRKPRGRLYEVIRKHLMAIH